MDLEGTGARAADAHPQPLGEGARPQVLLLLCRQANAREYQCVRFSQVK